MNRSLVDTITQAVRDVADANGEGRARALHEPCLDTNAWTYVKECLDSGWVSTAGPFVERFETTLAQTTGVEHVVSTVTGTAALHLCLMVAGVGPGDEVIMPALTFVATANAASYVGAIPHFADIEPCTLGLDAVRLVAHLDAIAERTDDGVINRRTGRPIRAVVCMHTFGHPVDLDSLAALCAQWGLVLIEDAAEALGSYYKNRHVGGVGRLAALSFNGNKIATSGGGGALLTNDAELASTARHLATTAKQPHPWAFDHDQVGYNYRLPSINAALGCAQLDQLDSLLSAKRELAQAYARALADIDGVVFFEDMPWATSNAWLSTLLLDESNIETRDILLQALHNANLGARPVWTPMHRLPMYSECPRMDLHITEDMLGRVVCLPSSAFLAPEQSITS